MTILVPRGPEARAVHRSAPNAVPIHAAKASAGAADAVRPGDVAAVVGLCGALHRHSVGDVVVYDRVRDDAHEVSFDPALRDALIAALRSDAQLPSVTAVTAFTSPTIVTTARERTAVAERYGADVVDMEGTFLGGALAARGIRCSTVRVVSDDTEHDLPDVTDALDQNGNLRILGLASAIVRAPVPAIRMIAHVRTSLRVLTRVAAVLAAFSPPPA